MMRSLFSGIAGLKSHQLDMDVISNNVANVNTIGFKKSRITFADTFYETLKNASAPTTAKGGTNLEQVGTGNKTATIDQIFTQGSFETTGKNSDVAIDGEGFFVLDDNGKTSYTRAGNFDIDGSGFFVHSATGMRIMGWQADVDKSTGIASINSNKQIGVINFMPGEKLPAKATSNVEYRSNLQETASARSLPEEQELIYGDAATQKKMSVKFEKLDENTWNFSVTDDAGNPVDLDNDPLVTQLVGQVTTWPDGKIKDVTVSGNSATSILFTGANFQDANGDGLGDVFLVEKTPSAPPLDNFWTFDDINGNKNDLTVKFEKTGLNQYNWKVYDENNQPIDLNGDGVIDAAGTDFGSIAFDQFGNITSFASPTVAVGPNLEPPGTYFTYNGLTIDLSSTNRQLELKEAVTGNSRNINIGSDSIKFQFTAGEDKLTFDEIPGAKHSTSISVYDSLGEAHQLIMNFEKLDDNRWRYYTSLSDDDSIVQNFLTKNPEAKAGTDLTASEREAIMNNLFQDPTYGNTRSGILVFNTLGKIDESATRTANNAIYPDMTPKLRFSPLNANSEAVTLNFAGVTQFDSDFTTAARSQDGYEMGMLQTYNINDNGDIQGVYSNGYKQPIGRIGLAVFYNPMGLNQIGGTLWQPTPNSGNAVISTPGTGKAGKMQAGMVEMSNVDLSQEFTDMIIAQRGFQANSRTITTADQLLQELLNLKR